VRLDNTTLLDTLINAGAKINLCDKNGMIAMHYAAANGSAAAVQTLLQAGANPNLAGDTGLTPLMLAAIVPTHFRKEKVELLIQHGANISVVDAQGNNALDYLHNSALPDID